MSIRPSDDAGNCNFNLKEDTKLVGLIWEFALPLSFTEIVHLREERKMSTQIESGSAQFLLGSRWNDDMSEIK